MFLILMMLCLQEPEVDDLSKFYNNGISVAQEIDFNQGSLAAMGVCYETLYQYQDPADAEIAYEAAVMLYKKASTLKTWCTVPNLKKEWKKNKRTPKADLPFLKDLLLSNKALAQVMREQDLQQKLLGLNELYQHQPTHGPTLEAIVLTLIESGDALSAFHMSLGMNGHIPYETNVRTAYAMARAQLALNKDLTPILTLLEPIEKWTFLREKAPLDLLNDLRHQLAEAGKDPEALSRINAFDALEKLAKKNASAAKFLLTKGEANVAVKKKVAESLFDQKTTDLATFLLCKDSMLGPLTSHAAKQKYARLAKKWLEKEPDHPELIAILLLTEENKEEKEALTRRGYALAPSHFVFVQNYAQQLAQEEDWQVYAEVIKSYIEKEVNAPFLRKVLETLAGRQRWAEAVDLALVALTPEKELDEGILYAVGQFAADLPDSSYPHFRQFTAHRLITKGRMAANQFRFYDGMKLVQAAAPLGPQSAEIHLLAGNLGYQGGFFMDAITSFTQACEHWPKEAALFELLGDTYLYTDQGLKAKEAYQKAMDLDDSRLLVKDKFQEARHMVNAKIGEGFAVVLGGAAFANGGMPNFNQSATYFRYQRRSVMAEARERGLKAGAEGARLGYGLDETQPFLVPLLHWLLEVEDQMSQDLEQLKSKLRAPS